MSKRILWAMLLLLAVSVDAHAGLITHVVKPIAAGAYGLGKGVATAGVNVGKVVAYPVAHPKKTAHAAKKVVL